MTHHLLYGLEPGRLARTYDERPTEPFDQPDPQPRRPDWLIILTVSLFILTLLIAWLSDAHLRVRY